MCLSIYLSPGAPIRTRILILHEFGQDRLQLLGAHFPRHESRDGLGGELKGIFGL